MQNNIEKNLSLTHYYFVYLNVLILDDRQRAFWANIQMLMWLIRFRRKNQTTFIMLLANVRKHPSFIPEIMLATKIPSDYAPFFIVVCALSPCESIEDADNDGKRRRSRGNISIANLISGIMGNITDILKHRNIVPGNRAKRTATEFKWRRQYYCGNRRYFRKWIMDLFGSMFQNSIVLYFDIASYSSIYCKPRVGRKFWCQILFGAFTVY